MSLTPQQRSLLDALFAAIDAMDVERFVGFIKPDGQFRFGSAPAVTGHAAIGEAVGGFFETITGLKHTLAMAAAVESTLVCEGEVTYSRHDGSEITLPFVDVFEMDGDEIVDYKIYMDVGPLYAQ